ncbi:MAG TPA: hypothetical protein VKX39_09595 [Bryobacteraceae bacterium]|jgi:hypothetical protein|nr:hypothetical protein [Bryobacteraceae bacterium]
MNDRDLIRHAVATIAYRGGKTIRDAPPEFADFAGAGKTPAQILAHIGDLFDWALRTAKGDTSWRDSQPLAWEREKERFFSTLAAFDAYLAGGEPVRAPREKLFQGPVADALTHVGQLAMLRRLAGCAMKGENYFVAWIEVGRVGPEQAKAAREFD